MACDICGKTGVTLVDLRANYQTEHIKQVCSECESTVNDHLWELRRLSAKMNERWFKRFIINLKHKYKKLSGVKN